MTKTILFSELLKISCWSVFDDGSYIKDHEQKRIPV